MTENGETHIKALYESVGRGFESLPSHQEKPEHVCVLVFLFVSTMEWARTGRRRAAPQAISPVGCCLARGSQRLGMSTVGDYRTHLCTGFFIWSSAGFEQQRSRPPPAAETGRRGWGSAPFFQSPAKGLRKKRQAQLAGGAARQAISPVGFLGFSISFPENMVE